MLEKKTNLFRCISQKYTKDICIIPRFWRYNPESVSLNKKLLKDLKLLNKRNFW